MYDLNVLSEGETFHLDPSAPSRLALVHNSFRTVSLRRGIERQKFAAHFPALGLLNLAHSLRVDAAAGLLPLPEIRYFDQDSFVDESAMAAGVEAWLAAAARPIVAASSYTSTIDRLEQFLARFDPRARLLIVGGAHASLAPDIEKAHIVVRGEGGAAMRHILTTFGTDTFGEGPDAAGICFVIDGRSVQQNIAYDRSLEALASPAFAYDLLPPPDARIYATNFTRMLGERPQVYICTQSCRARCTFCSTYLIHGRQVARPASLVVQDLQHLVGELGHDTLELHDDDLLQHPELNEILAALAATGVPWFCYARAEELGPTEAKRLASAGCRRVFLGVESMRQEALDYFHKHTTIKQNAIAVESLAEAGVGVIAGMIIGSPADTAADAAYDLERFLELPLLAINCSILSPDPGTLEFRRARRRQDLRTALGGDRKLRLMPDVERYGAASPVGLPTVCLRLNKQELNALQAVIDATFYARRRIWDGLTEGRSDPQRQLIGDYYRFLGHELDRLVVPELELPAPWPGLAERAGQELAAGPWAAEAEAAVEARAAAVGGGAQ